MLAERSEQIGRREGTCDRYFCHLAMDMIPCKVRETRCIRCCLLKELRHVPQLGSASTLKFRIVGFVLQFEYGMMAGRSRLQTLLGAAEMPRMAGRSTMTTIAGPSRLPARLNSIASSGSGLHHQVPSRTRPIPSPRGIEPGFFSSRAPRSSSEPSSSRLTTALGTSAPALPLLAVFPFSDPSLVDTVHSLLLSVPLPAGYTIILLTLLVRTGVTLPVTLWQRARARRTREIIVPEMKRLNDELAGPVARECRKAGMGYEEYKRELKRQVSPVRVGRRVGAIAYTGSWHHIRRLCTRSTVHTRP